MAASCIHRLVYVNNCCTCASVGVYEWLLHTHTHLLVYMNGCSTRTYVGVYERLNHTHGCWCILMAASMYIFWLYEWLVHTHICWCMWTAVLRVHLLLPLGTITVSPHTWCHHKLYWLQNIIIHLVLSQTLYGTCSITTHPLSSQTLVWMIQYHHTSSIITYSCMDGTVSPHIKYHHKIFV